MGSFGDSIGLALRNLAGKAVKNTCFGGLSVKESVFIYIKIYREEYLNTVVFKVSDRCW